MVEPARTTWGRTRRSRVVIGSASVVVLAACSLIAGGVASADPTTPTAGQVSQARAKATSVAAQVGVMQAKLVVAQAKLNALGVQVDTASEAYDGAVFHLQQAQAQLAAAQQAASGAHQQYVAAQVAVGRLAAAAYQGGGMTLGLGAVMSATSPSTALDALSSLNQLARQQSGTLDQMKAARVVADVMNKQAVSALAVVTKATAAAGAARASVQGKIRAESAQVGVLNTEIAQLTAALNSARAHSVQLTRARAAGLARAAAAAVAARAAAAAASAGSGSSGGSTSNSGGSAGGSAGGSTGSSGGGGSLPPATPAGVRAAIRYAEAQLGKPYQYAGAGPATFDCSGLTMMAWRAGGVSLPHWSVAQWELSTPVPESQARPGDLVFYATDPSNILTVHHVALYIGDGMMIEAPHTGAFVRISPVHGESDFFAFGRV